MTESDAAPGRGQQARLLAGSVSCLVGLLLAISQVYFALLGTGDKITAGTLGIGFCILGYYLDARKLATATVFLCVAAILFGMARSQGIL